MAGFPPDTLTFLRDLAADPTPTFFDAHRHRYRDHVAGRARAFVEALAPGLHDLAPGLTADPRVHGSILHPRQDVRLGGGRPPYRDHLGLIFWEGERATARSVLFLRLRPGSVTLGAGARRLDAAGLKAYRHAVLDPVGGDALAATIHQVTRAGWPLHGATLVRGPRGVATDDPVRAGMLRHTALWAEDDLPVPGVLGSARFAAWCLRRWEQLLPLHRWLHDELGAA